MNLQILREDALLITGNNGEYLFTDSGGTINDYSVVKELLHLMLVKIIHFKS